MSRNHKPLSDEQLDRHIAALRDEPVGEEPSQDLIARTQSMIRDRMGEPRFTIGRRPFLERLVAMTLTQRIAALVMITLGALTLYVMFALFNTLAPSVALADVVEKLKAARTLSYDQTTTMPGQPSVTMRVYLADPDRLRMEGPGGGASIRQGHRMLILNPLTHVAVRVDITGLPTTRARSVVDDIRKMTDLKGDPLGPQQIDGVPAKGFRTRTGSQTITVWADEKTATPLRIEMSMPYRDDQMHTVMDHFQIDPALDDSLFSLDPPQGYTLSEQTIEQPVETVPEKAIINMLRLYADNSGGSFPKQVDNVGEYADVLKNAKAAASTHPGNPEILAMSTKLGGGFGVVSALARSGGYGYDGAHVKLADKDKPLMWFKLNAKSGNYRVIFGDLHVGELPIDQLPPLTTQPTR